MKTRFFLLLMAISFSINAQNNHYTFSDIKLIVQSKYYEVQFDSIQISEVVILEGLLYEGEKSINQKLSEIERKDLRVIELVDLTKPELYCRKYDFIILLGKGENQSKQYKKQLLGLLKENLTQNIPNVVIRDFICKECLMVVIDGKPLEMFESRTIVDSISVSDIDYISQYKSVNPAVYGSRGVNGLIEIYLKKK